MAIPSGITAELRMLDPATGQLDHADWPPTWTTIRTRIENRLTLRPGQPGLALGPSPDDGPLFEFPIFRSGEPVAVPGPPRRREVAWMIFEVDFDAVRAAILPELIQRDLGTDYEVLVVTRTDPPAVIYQSDTTAATLQKSADASVALFDLQNPLFARAGRGPGPGREFAAAPFGRWQMYVRHRAGSLEAVVQQARWHNLTVSAVLLLLLIATAGALVRYAGKAAELARLQVDFVAGVSHELRTPLTVIRTAAYNLRGKMSHNPPQVERYGELIQQESTRLQDLVEQVLQFAGANAGRVIQPPELISVQAVIDDTVEASKAVIQAAHCDVEKAIDPELPRVMADPLALKHALQNLLTNAAKYGSSDKHWIGLFASRVDDPAHPSVEIRVADHGPGIPADEQKHIFDPFFRGRRAVQDQIRGTGLGLNLVKKIVEAHGGTIQVKSEPNQGTQFIVRIPAAPVEDAGAAG